MSYEFWCVYLSVTVDYAEMQLSTTVFSLRRFFVEMTYEFLCVKLSVTVDYVEMQVYGVALDDVDFVLFV